MESSTSVELTPEQSIQILEKAKEILGPNGEHWAQGFWVGLPYDDDEDDSLYAEATWADANNPDAKFCVMGALEQAAYELQITNERENSDRLADPVSLQKLVNSYDKWEGLGVIDVNDSNYTTFETISKLIDERLAQLRDADPVDNDTPSS